MGKSFCSICQEYAAVFENGELFREHVLANQQTMYGFSIDVIDKIQSLRGS
jgi:hypothetical protein